MKTILKLNLLTACIVLAQQSYALEQMDEQVLSNVTGQDGIVITHEMSKATAEKITWYDPSPQENVKMGIGLHNFNIEAKPGQSIKSQLELDVGATNQGAGVRIAASISPFTATADLNLVKINCSIANCEQSSTSLRTPGIHYINSLGSIGLSTSSAMRIVLQTTAGLFNQNEIASIDFRLQNATISHKLGNNSVILNDFNFNFAGLGYMYIAADEGIVLTTRKGSEDNYINLGRVMDTSEVATGRAATNPGVNIDLRYHTPSNERKNIMRMGASGAVTNARLALSGDQSKIGEFDIGNKAPNGNLTREIKTATGYGALAGAGGLHLALAADFTNEFDENLPSNMLPTTLEIGHTGKGSHAIEFSKLRPLTTRDVNNRLHGKNAYIDFGDIYFNTITGEELEFIVNNNLQSILFSPSNTLTQVLNSEGIGTDYALVAVRGFDFQSIAAKARFISDNSLPELTGDGGSWGIGIPVYNLNANVALRGVNYGTAGNHGLGYNIMASTQGYGIDAKTGLPSTTSIILIDGADGIYGEPVNYYAGLRNIDALIESNGIIGYEDEGIHIYADKFLIAASMELAIGQLPGSKYNCTTQAELCGSYVAYDNFGNLDDVLTNITFMFDGSGQLLIIPGMDPTISSPHTNFLSYEGKFRFRTLKEDEISDESNIGSYFRISNEDLDEDGELQVSAFNFNRIQGELGLNGKIRLSEDTVVMDNQVKINPTQNIRDPLRTNFAMQTNNDSLKKMADIALTGGTIRSTLGIKPR